MVEWYAPSGGEKLETDPLSSIRDDERSAIQEMVVVRNKGFSVPVLRMEHLGKSGSFMLTDLEITVVKERWIWVFGRWFIALGFTGWCYGLIRSWPGISKRRASLASLVWLMVGICFVVPGPWTTIRPMGGNFKIGSVGAVPSSVPAASENPPPQVIGITSGAIAAEGKMPDKSSVILQVKHRFPQLRTLLHALLLCGPSLIMLCLIGRKPTLPLMIMTALAVELAQAAFGYGFDWTDVSDLICDALGIAGACWIHARLAKRLGGFCHE
jgi:hypothetical protein